MKELFYTESNSHLFLNFVFIKSLYKKLQFFVIMRTTQFCAKTYDRVFMRKIMQKNLLKFYNNAQFR